MSRSNFMVYGANGYTGRLIAEEAVARGLRPILAGRNSRKIEALAAELGCPCRVFRVSKARRVAEEIVGVPAVLHCAGPFSATAEPMMEACLAVGTDYLDITGEINVIEAAARRHERAVRAGVSLIPAVGFDVVPSDCLAAMLHDRLPGATLLQLAFSGSMRISPGTARTALQTFGRGRVRKAGRITRVPTAWKTMEIPFDDGPRQAVTVPWGDVASAFYTTGIGHIETYMAMPAEQIEAIRKARPMLGLLSLPPVRYLLGLAIRRRVTGPTLEQRQTLRGSLWGRVSDDSGRSVEATLQTPEPYRLTVLTALESVQRVLDLSVPRGFSTPAQAFGRNFILDIPGTSCSLSPAESPS